jgi:hypothetical protein
MTPIPCRGYQVIGRVAFRCNSPATWDLLAQSDSDALVSAQCDRCLPLRLREWYQSAREVLAQFRDNLVAVPHDPLRWVDDEEFSEDVHLTAVLA